MPVAGSEIDRVSRSRMVFSACGSQHTVVSTAPVMPIESVRVQYIGRGCSDDLMTLCDSGTPALHVRPSPRLRARETSRNAGKKQSKAPSCGHEPPLHTHSVHDIRRPPDAQKARGVRPFAPLNM